MSAEIIKKIKRIEITARRFVDEFFGGEYHSLFKGMGLEFQEVREYVPGDDVKNIDWNVTARANKPFVRKYREERELSVMIAIDLSLSLDFGSCSDRKRDLAGYVAAALAFSAIRNNDRVGLVLFSEDIELYIPPRKGSRHILRILREAVYFRPRGRAADISSAVTFVNRVMNRKGIVIFISDFLAEGFEREFRLIASRQELIPVIIADPAERTAPPAAVFRFNDPETGRISVSSFRTVKARKKYEDDVTRHFTGIRKFFRSLGTDSVELFTDQDWVATLRLFFKRRIRKKTGARF